MDHIFSTSPIAQKLWKHLASCAGIIIEGLNLQHVIINWWRALVSTKLKIVYKIISMVVIWELWKRRNARRHDKDVKYQNLVLQCHQLVYYFLRNNFSWIEIPRDLEGILGVLNNYRPQLH